MELKDIIAVLKDKKKMKGNMLVVKSNNVIGLMKIEKQKSLLEQLQGWVGGYIELGESDYIDDYVIVVNEEGLMKNLPFNKIMNLLFGMELHGDVVILDRREMK
jgi:hypothetical protein